MQDRVKEAGAAIERPVLTMPEAEAELLAAAYAQADVILEYGSGGSTVLAAEMPGKSVYSVESDQSWAEKLRAWFVDNPPAAGTRVEVIWSDIGPTKAWGRPVDGGGWRGYARYPFEIWQRESFRHPDVVLVDGRFREGCVLATAFLARRPVTLLVDDYAERPQYHEVETFVGPPRMTGRMARFEIIPQPVPAQRLLRIMQLTTRP